MPLRKRKQWNVEDHIQKLSIKLPTRPRSTKRVVKEITLPDLQHALLISARLVDSYGEAYLPYFDRVSLEIEEHLKKQKKLELISRLASISVVSE